MIRVGGWAGRGRLLASKGELSLAGLRRAARECDAAAASRACAAVMKSEQLLCLTLVRGGSVTASAVLMLADGRTTHANDNALPASERVTEREATSRHATLLRAGVILLARGRQGLAT